MYASLHLLAGAPAAGKTTLLPYLLGAADGLVVMDLDELLEEGKLLGVTIADPAAAAVWPAYDRMWERIVAIVRRAGHPVLLLCPVPDAGELAPGGRWAPPVRWALLDCPDEVRLHRLKERGTPQEWVAEAMADAAHGRALAPTVFTGDDPAELAARILAWVRTGTH
ncbi:AAA family ATPase [Nonomuraea sp. SBT364]|uniref:AAA family ATPase n=1 Tax=Nonomuraea sp. SBT364 TaxID=1580530 RepID=UPI00066BBA67|nr:AAA family ATPase [Nonomuraea sp. SBT364]